MSGLANPDGGGVWGGAFHFNISEWLQRRPHELRRHRKSLLNHYKFTVGSMATMVVCVFVTERERVVFLF